VIAAAPSAASNFTGVNDVAVVTAAENRPTSTFTGVAVADVPSNVTDHCTIRARSPEPVPSSITLFAVAADNAIASTDTQ
jgi:hypothetical protein